MAISVVCPGCMKRFQVSDQFAGMKGPCPSCKTIIDIPKEQLVIHGDDDFVTQPSGKPGKGGAKTGQRPVFRPINRVGMDFSRNEVIFGLAGTSAALFLAWLVGVLFPLETHRMALNFIGVLGVLAISFPLSLVGYRITRDLDGLDILSGMELNKRTALCGMIYAVLWVAFESFARYMNVDLVFQFFYMVPFVALSVFAAHVVLDFELPKGLGHYLVFLFSVLILRGVAGLGWIWMATDFITSGATGRPPAPRIVP